MTSRLRALMRVVTRHLMPLPGPLPAAPTVTAPLPGTTKDKEPKYDEVTHTGQAWDQEDWRLVRFNEAPKQVNPNIAMNLIAEIPPQACQSHIVSCDGGGGALGHPKIYINLDKPGNHACGYCGLRYFRESQLHDGSEHIQVQVAGKCTISLHSVK